MLFRDIGKGTIFEMIAKDGQTVTAIKTGDRHAIALADGEELKIHPNKKVDLQRAMRPGDFAIEKESGKPLIVERVRNGEYWGEYILRIGGTTLADAQVSVFDRKQGKTGQDLNEVYITLKRAENAVQKAQNALVLLKDMVEELKEV